MSRTSSKPKTDKTQKLVQSLAERVRKIRDKSQAEEQNLLSNYSETIRDAVYLEVEGPSDELEADSE